MNDYRNALTSNIATTEADISKLRKIKKKQYTALQLHQVRGAMLNRVQRIEDRRHWQWVQKQKQTSATKLAGFKTKLEEYNALLAEQAALPASKDPEVLQPMAPVLTEPMVSPLIFPIRTRTRKSTKRRLRQSRYGH